MVKKYYFGKAKYVKIAFIAKRRFFKIFVVQGNFLQTPSFSTSTGFMMAHFEAKIQEKTIESLKTSAVKG